MLQMRNAIDQFLSLLLRFFLAAACHVAYFSGVKGISIRQGSVRTGLSSVHLRYASDSTRRGMVRPVDTRKGSVWLELRPASSLWSVARLYVEVQMRIEKYTQESLV